MQREPSEPGGATPAAGIRALGGPLEAVHAPVCSAPEPQAEYAARGLRGSWRGDVAPPVMDG